MKTLIYTRRFVFLCLLLLSFTVFAPAQTPTVTKVEPQSWWTGSTVNPIRLLIRGTNLTGARIEAQGGGVTASNFKTNAAGTYLFADLAIDRSARPGRRTLRVTTERGNAPAAFEVTAPLARQGRFQGFDRDDVMYLIMPDRFADGDRANNNPPESPGLYDRGANATTTAATCKASSSVCPTSSRSASPPSGSTHGMTTTTGSTKKRHTKKVRSPIITATARLIITESKNASATSHSSNVSLTNLTATASR
jgi:hypothetical protein